MFMGVQIVEAILERPLAVGMAGPGEGPDI